jgi:ribonucleotide reductase beta subunit family protein with ferritin-like domain
MLDPVSYRPTTLPIDERYRPLWDLYQQQKAAFWIDDEIDFSNDYSDFLKLNSDEQRYIKMQIAFFASFDGIVGFNIGNTLSKKIHILEYRYNINFQSAMEDIHSIVYANNLDVVTKDAKEKDELNNAWKNNKDIKKLADLARSWADNKNLSVAENLVAFAFIEGVMFSGSFASIFWIKHHKNTSKSKSGKAFMPGLCQANELISRDEGMHVKVAVTTYMLMKKRLPEKNVHQIAKTFTEATKEFMSNALKVSLIGINISEMNKYIEYCADRLLVMMKYNKLYNAKHKLTFMNTIGLHTKGNFFEKVETAYKNARVGNAKKQDLIISDDF